MRISDWSSDVCSSDLEQPAAVALDAAEVVPVEARRGDHQQVAALQELPLGPAEQPRDRATAEEHALHIQHLIDQRRARAAEPLARQREGAHVDVAGIAERSEEHTSELQSIMRI